MASSHRHLWRCLLLILAALLGGCPLVPVRGLRPEATELRGRVAWVERYQAQASTGEIAMGATVSLIDPGTGQTLGTTLTQPDGSFSLSLSNWTPQADQPYLLEAIKGLSGGGLPNRAGASNARLRTIVSKVNGAWKSLTAGSILLSRSTTALCVGASLKGLTPSQQQALLATVTSGTPDVFAGSAQLGAGEYAELWGLVDTALSLNQDPVRAIARNTSNGTFVRLEGAPLVTDLDVTAGSWGDTVQLYGAGFDPQGAHNLVDFNGTPATGVVVDATGTRLTVLVPQGATTGPVHLQVGALVMTVGTFSVQSPGRITTAAGSLTPRAGTPARAWPVFSYAVTMDASGTLYGVTDDVVFKLSPGGQIEGVAGNGPQGFSGDGGPATEALLNQPHGVAADAAGNLFIADTYNRRLRMVPSTGGTYFGQAMTARAIYTIAGNGMFGYAGDGGLATGAWLGQPRGVVVDPAGNVVVADESNHRIRMIAATTGTYFGIAMTAHRIYTLAGNGTAAYAGDGGAATAASLKDPYGLALDPAGNLYVADRGNHCIRMIPRTSGTYFGQAMTANAIYTLAGNGYPAYSANGGPPDDGGPATGAAMYAPSSVVVDASGNLIVVDQNLQRIRVIAATSGTCFGVAMTANYIYTIAGLGSVSFGGDGGPATVCYLGNPWAVTLDPGGNVLIADTGNMRLRMIPRTTGTYYGQAMTANSIYTFAGNGQQYSGGDGAAATHAACLGAHGAAADAAGHLYLVDASDHRLRMVPQTSGTYFGQAMTAHAIYTVAGTGVAGYSGEGALATGAKLNTPRGVAVDAAGHLYLADASSHRVRMIPRNSGTYFGQAMTANNIYTLAGNGTSGYLGDGVAATSTRLAAPNGVAVDGAGNVYVADMGNHRVRMIPATSGTCFGQAMTAGSIYTVAGTGATGLVGDGGLATSATVASPHRVAVDAAGHLYVSDKGNHRIRMLPRTSGTYFGQAMTADHLYTIAGGGNGVTNGGPATQESLSSPSGVAVDGAGNVYLADGGHHQLRMVCRVTGTYYGRAMIAANLYNLAGTGVAGNSGEGGLGTLATLRSPTDVALDGQGTVYLVDQGGLVKGVK